LPAEIEKVIGACAIGFPNASFTTNRTESPTVAPGATVPGSGLVRVNAAGGPATTIIRMLLLWTVPIDAEMEDLPTGPTVVTSPVPETVAMAGALLM